MQEEGARLVYLRWFRVGACQLDPDLCAQRPGSPPPSAEGTRERGCGWKPQVGITPPCERSTQTALTDPIFPIGCVRT